MFEPEAAENTQAKILIVDDDMMGRELLCAQVASHGFTYDTAIDGADAVRKAASTKPDIILLDVLMPGIDGIEACRQIKALDETNHIPIIMITSYIERDVRIASLEAGANDFIEKPIDMTELMIKIRNLINLKEFENIKVKNRLLAQTITAIETAKREWEQSMDCILDVVVLADANGRILRCNKMLCTLTGKSYKQLLNSPWRDVLREEGFAGIADPAECSELFHKNGKWFQCSVYDLKVKDQSFVPGSVISLHDITDLKTAEEKMENNRMSLQKAVDQISLLIQEVALKKNFSVRFENPNRKSCYEFLNCKKISCICHSEKNKNQRCWQIAGTFCKGQVQGHFAQKYKSCTECSYFRDTAGDPYCYMGEQFNNMMHILETQHLDLENTYNELKTAHSQILQQEKMASIGQLAAGVAHEINNPMGFIISNLNTLSKYVGKISEFMETQLEVIEEYAGISGIADNLKKIDEKKRSLKIDYITEDITNLIHESLEGADRVKKIVQDLKSFSRIDEAEYKISDINAGLESTINIVWNELKYKATLVKEYGDIPLTKCRPGQLNQVFMNFLVNAAQAIEKHGEIHVRTWQEDTRINIAISDTGCGIPEEIQRRIFEPFFTTKEVGKGTGLGLSIAYDIIKKHNGEITVDSTVGKGTTFTISIPVIVG
jgi:PAS domain S-box-containing protein